MSAISETYIRGHNILDSLIFDQFFISLSEMEHVY